MFNGLANGYERMAHEFMAVRSDAGHDVIRKWGERLKSGASVLDVGCGHGLPLTKILIETGCKVSAIDASPTMIAAFKRNFPNIETECEAVEDSIFFGKKFDAILMVGLIFLLPAETQKLILFRLAYILRPGGQFLFSAPKEKGEWVDLLTDQTSWSLGEEVYKNIVLQVGLKLLPSYFDKSGSHYYSAQKPRLPVA